MCCRESGHHPLAVVMAPGRSARGTCESLGGVKIAATGLGDRFPHAVEVLNEYFRRDRMTSWLPRLNEIFSVTEAAWERNVNRFDNKPIEHLLIAEAAPWTQPGDPDRKSVV